MTTRPFITVVSGLPRSGTSLMMQMVHAGGVPALTDQLRTADSDNPRGYFELERVKLLKSDSTWLHEAVGKSIKVIHMLVMDLPESFDYRVIFMNRAVDEVLRSQATMLQRSGRSGGNLPPDRMKHLFENQLTTVKKWLAERSRFATLDVEYAELIRDPAAYVKSVNDFLGGGLDTASMIAAVDPNLYRNRSG